MTFLGRLPQMVETINESCLKKDWETVQSISHQLKGLGGSFGYSEITAIAKKIHECARQHSDVGVDNYLDELNNELQVIVNANQNNRKAI